MDNKPKLGLSFDSSFASDDPVLATPEGRAVYEKIHELGEQSLDMNDVQVLVKALYPGKRITNKWWMPSIVLQELVLELDETGYVEDSLTGEMLRFHDVMNSNSDDFSLMLGHRKNGTPLLMETVIYSPEIPFPTTP